MFEYLVLITYLNLICNVLLLISTSHLNIYIPKTELFEEVWRVIAYYLKPYRAVHLDSGFYYV